MMLLVLLEAHGLKAVVVTFLWAKKVGVVMVGAALSQHGAKCWRKTNGRCLW